MGPDIFFPWIEVSVIFGVRVKTHIFFNRVLLYEMYDFVGRFH